jgi:hypothetical protein
MAVRVLLRSWCRHKLAIEQQGGVREGAVEKGLGFRVEP